MVVSFLRRRTRVADREQWRKRVDALLPRLQGALARQPGFRSLTYVCDAGGSGETLEITTWRSPADCANYVRNGGAALAATVADGFLPTADYPNGNWLRETYEVAP